MAVLRDLKNRVDELEDRGCDCSGSSWASELGFPILMIAIAATAYGCSAASEIDSRNTAYTACAAAKELTEPCKLILGANKTQ